MNEISYRLKWSEDLYWAYRRFKWQKMMGTIPLYRQEFWRRVILFLGGVTLCFLFVATTGRDSEWLMPMIVDFGLGWWIYYSYLLYRNRSDAANECEFTTSLPEAEITLDPTGIRMLPGHSDWRTKWAAFSPIESFALGLIAWDDHCHSGIVIPDKYFPSGTDRESVRTLLESWREAAQ